MTHLKDIIAATDLSAPSRHATDRAARLAKTNGATLTLVHTLGATALDDLRRWLSDSAVAQAAVEADARERLHALALDLGQRHGLTVQERLLTGHPVQAVTRHADEAGADLVVTGTRGAGFFRGVVIGSTAERIANRSGRPVLMVRQSPHEPYRRVLVPVDFSPWSAGAIVLALRAARRATLVLMHAIEVPFEGRMRLAGVSDKAIGHYRDAARHEASHKLRELAVQAGLATDRVQMITPDGADPWMLITQQEQEHDCDLIVIGRQGRHAVDELLLGSTTRMVISECSADVLVSTRSQG
ncbi:MAG TPA: universal stress protein [Burkholderiaceae bacterium]|nr:universal stress protein [Burkholderiaceae bacterium]